MTTTENQFERLRCIKRVDETSDASTFEFEHLDQRPFNFQAGQFLTFEINHYNNLLYRAYSICSSPAKPNSVTVAIKRVPGGKISNYLIDNLQAGHALPAMAPAGKFTREENKTTNNLLLMSAGSGITPCLAIARDILDTEQAINIHFIHSARRSDDVIMLSLLNELADKHKNFRLTMILETTDNATDFHGRLDKTMFAELVASVSEQTIFICGPSLYMKSVEEIVSATDFDMDYFHKESFVAEAKTGETVFSDITHEISVPAIDKAFIANDQQTLLDALHGAGIKVPYSCKSGVCGACKCKVSGNVVSTSQETLTAEQIELGYVLSCSTKANSDLVVEI
ncbi:hybrid-cluster NAD(P)-dependent oxidoreductase [Psychromonas marina]|uniref:Hybrid-cluster NAD(P)-dependent oxidoreductase n=1 Tax=Psychromonas marina TaxID=88364 RepID=A0ABQ6E0I1_9GAMM|nr:hybrid-cluster NAD(P)-dependent oxidoreductase [Psychromonas marina]GLS90929.1 hybrid-cluster NAD(P)-dependent oxidoreductase [Psychromonas marina]